MHAESDDGRGKCHGKANNGRRMLPWPMMPPFTPSIETVKETSLAISAIYLSLSPVFNISSN